MTTIHTFEDILAVLERNPELRDAMHRHILGEEIPELPAAVRQVQDIAVNVMQNQAELSATTRAAIEATANTLAQFMEQTTLLMANASERQTAIESDTAELREGQVGLTAGVAELRERVTRLESITTRILDDVGDLKSGMAQANGRLDSLETGQGELRAGMAQANERLGSLETGQGELKAGMAQANERLDSLETGQAELKAGQVELKAGQVELKAGMAQANERLDSLETGQAELTAGQVELKAVQAELRAGQAELTAGQVELKAVQTELVTGQVSMRGQLNRLTGSDYERRVVRRLRRSAERRFGLYNATVLHGITVPDNPSIPDLLDAGLQSGDITENEANEAELADIIIGGSSDTATVAYAVIEASVTIDRHDVDRAIARAAVIGKATGAPAMAVVAGTSISEADRQYADNNSVTVIILPD